MSGYYAAKARVAQGPSARAQADERLLVTVRTTFAKNRGRYGAPCHRSREIPQVAIV